VTWNSRSCAERAARGTRTSRGRDVGEGDGSDCPAPRKHDLLTRAFRRRSRRGPGHRVRRLRESLAAPQGVNRPALAGQRREGLQYRHRRRHQRAPLRGYRYAGSGETAVFAAAILVRLKQRLKLRQKILPLSASELNAYFKHCFRLAGNEFDAVFEPGTAEVLHALSGGIPRVANNLIESALSSAAENNQQQVGVATIKLVATEEFGLDTGVQVSEQAAPVERKQTPAASAAPADKPIDLVEPQPLVD